MRLDLCSRKEVNILPGSRSGALGHFWLAESQLSWQHHKAGDGMPKAGVCQVIALLEQGRGSVAVWRSCCHLWAHIPSSELEWMDACPDMAVLQGPSASAPLAIAQWPPRSQPCTSAMVGPLYSGNSVKEAYLETQWDRCLHHLPFLLLPGSNAG